MKQIKWYQFWKTETGYFISMFIIVGFFLIDPIIEFSFSSGSILLGNSLCDNKTIDKQIDL